MSPFVCSSGFPTAAKTIEHGLPMDPVIRPIRLRITRSNGILTTFGSYRTLSSALESLVADMGGGQLDFLTLTPTEIVSKYGPPSNQDFVEYTGSPEKLLPLYNLVHVAQGIRALTKDQKSRVSPECERLFDAVDRKAGTESWRAVIDEQSTGLGLVRCAACIVIGEVPKSTILERMQALGRENWIAAVALAYEHGLSLADTLAL